MHSTLDHSVQVTAGSELAAVEAGYGPLHRELAEFLGRQSVAATAIEGRQALIGAENANADLVVSFAQSLPHTIDNAFELGGEHPQYDARQIQANTVWLFGRHPYYIVGKAPSRQDENTENLLVAPPVDDTGRRDAGTYPLIVPVRKDDWELGTSLLVANDGREFTRQEIDAMMDSQNGRLYLTHMSGASLATSFKDYWGKANEEKILKHGIRTSGDYSLGEHAALRRIPSEMLSEYEVPTHLAKLATAFGVEDKLRALIHGRHAEAGPQLTVEELLQQNAEMRAAIRGMMLASGVMAEGEVDRLLENRYPSYSQLPR